MKFRVLKCFTAVVVFSLSISADCNKESAGKIPPCIQEKIDAIMQQPRFNPPASVYRYKYQQQYVYLFTSKCCDQYNYVYDRFCKLVCAPTGGVTGNGDGRCPTFKQLASEETLIWRDTR
jgi:uncharacterized protein DUF6970